MNTKVIESVACLAVGGLVGYVAAKVTGGTLGLPKKLSKKEKEMIEDIPVEDLDEVDQSGNFKEA